MKTTIRPTLLTVICLFAAISTASADQIRVSAGGPAIEGILKPIKPAFEKASGHTLILVETGGKFGVQQLEKGEADAMVAGFSAEGLKNLITKEAVAVADPNAFQAVAIRQDKVFVAVNSTNPVTKLSKDQLKGLFTEKIANWKEVGGQDSPVIVIWAKLIPGPNGAFQQKILDGAPPAKEALEVNSLEDIKVTLASTPQAIAIYPSTAVAAGVKIVETPEVTRPTTLFTKGAPSPNVRKLIDFITGEGQKYIK